MLEHIIEGRISHCFLFTYMIDISTLGFFGRKSEGEGIIPSLTPPLVRHDRDIPLMTNNYMNGGRIVQSLLSTLGDISSLGMGVVSTPFDW
jgi:hypothetical protein